LIACALVSARHTAVSAQQAPARAGLEGPPDCNGGGEPCGAVVRGLIGFLDRSPAHLDSNGRSCADCHMPSDHFQLSPADAEARFQLMQFVRRFNPRYDDPLFRPIDADDFRSHGAEASDFSNLRQNGLVRVTMPLPANIRLVDPATGLTTTETSVDIWRSVPTVNNVAITGADGLNAWARGPNNTGGYQLDARVATLQDQALGALRAHAEVVDQVPERLLDDIASFQRTLFSSPRVAALAAAIGNNVTPLPDPDPPLTELEQQGKTVFVRACTQCHGGPSFTSAQAPVPRYQDISTTCPRPVDTAVPARWSFAACAPGLARNARTYEIVANNTTSRRSTSDPGRALLTGFVGGPAPADDWQKMDVPGLRGISHTAPYFHNNSAATLEAVVDHYTEFFKRVRALNAPAIPPVLTTNGIDVDRPHRPEERAALLAYLRKL
jgi:cytochrome c peroxidase